MLFALHAKINIQNSFPFFMNIRNISKGQIMRRHHLISDSNVNNFVCYWCPNIKQLWLRDSWPLKPSKRILNFWHENCGFCFGINNLNFSITIIGILNIRRCPAFVALEICISKNWISFTISFRLNNLMETTFSPTFNNNQKQEKEEKNVPFELNTFSIFLL